MPSDQERIDQNLGYLREGKPIDRDGYGLIRQSGSETREAFCRRVVELTKSGPQSGTHSTWLKATYGGGKTQALHLLSEALGANQFGQHKVLMCKVDLNREFCTSAQGFQMTLFERASVLSSPDEASALTNLATHLLGDDPSPSKSAENIVSVGVDILSTAINFKAPGSGILAKRGLGLLKRRWTMRRWYLTKAIRKRGLKDAEATELMIRWMQYSQSPNEKRWRSLNDYIHHLAEKGIVPANVEKGGAALLALSR